MSERMTLVDRLRGEDDSQLYFEAANKIEELEAENKKLKHDVGQYMEIANTEINQSATLITELRDLAERLQSRKVDNPTESGKSRNHVIDMCVDELTALLDKEGNSDE